MTKRAPRRKATRKKKSSLGVLWWGAGIACVGWLVFDANRDTFQSLAPQVASLFDRDEDAPRRTAAIAPAAPRSSRPATEPAVRETTRPRPAPSAPRAAPVPEAPITTAAIPHRRPERPATSGAVVSSATKATGRLMTAAKTPLYRDPSATAEAWTTLAAGQPVRVTARRGEWRRVESGIFTGWVKADAVHAEKTQAMPERTQTARAAEAPVPPGAIPGAGR